MISGPFGREMRRIKAEHLANLRASYRNFTAQGMSGETWKPSPIFGDRYEVSSEGRIRSMRGVKAPFRDKDGYPTVNLHRDGERRSCNIHRLVCRAFHGEPNPLHTEVAHLDGTRSNASAANLKWVSKVENQSHKRFHGTHSAGERNGYAKLTEAQAREIKEKASSVPHRDVAAEYGVSRRTVEEIASGKRWPHLGKARQPGPKDAPKDSPDRTA